MTQDSRHGYLATGPRTCVTNGRDLTLDQFEQDIHGTRVTDRPILYHWPRASHHTGGLPLGPVSHVRVPPALELVARGDVVRADYLFYPLLCGRFLPRHVTLQHADAPFLENLLTLASIQLSTMFILTFPLGVHTDFGTCVTKTTHSTW